MCNCYSLITTINKYTAGSIETIHIIIIITYIIFSFIIGHTSYFEANIDLSIYYHTVAARGQVVSRLNRKYYIK